MCKYGGKNKFDNFVRICQTTNLNSAFASYNHSYVTVKVNTSLVHTSDFVTSYNLNASYNRP